MPLLITFVFFEKQLGIKFISREAEVNPKALEIPRIWNFQKLVHLSLSRWKNLWRQTNGFGSWSKNLD
jgi:hypothetical protein